MGLAEPSFSTQAVFTAFLGGGLWMFIAGFAWSIKADRIKTDSHSDFLLGPCPTNPQERATWRWGRQAIYGLMVAFASFIVLALIEIIRGSLTAS